MMTKEAKNRQTNIPPTGLFSIGLLPTSVASNIVLSNQILSNKVTLPSGDNMSSRVEEDQDDRLRTLPANLSIGHVNTNRNCQRESFGHSEADNSADHFTYDCSQNSSLDSNYRQRRHGSSQFTQNWALLNAAVPQNNFMKAINFDQLHKDSKVDQNHASPRNLLPSGDNTNKFTSVLPISRNPGQLVENNHLGYLNPCNSLPGDAEIEEGSIHSELDVKSSDTSMLEQSLGKCLTL